MKRDKLELRIKSPCNTCDKYPECALSEKMDILQDRIDKIVKAKFRYQLEISERPFVSFKGKLKCFRKRREIK